MIQQFKLIKKEIIADNVFELIFEGEKELIMKPGQFITFLIDKIGGRAYSILKLKGKKITLIIKKWELDNGGRGGSKIICELNIGDSLKGVGPAGHFLLQNNNKPKLFIGTGTGLVPLYNMIDYQLKQNQNTNIKLIFGIRTKEDIFYIENLEKLSLNNPNFSYDIYISRVKDLHNFKLKHGNKEIQSGYTTNYLSIDNIKQYKEVYICGIPAMIESTIDKLEKFHFIKNENIFYESY